ncbi:MAG: hypothetical protein A2Y62_06265 [Candidatus Fischerbacteria bacterium RBG_13_37_8]|uniref:NAD(P)-binding domain-containing protein n=1 Tax=Candidatus Fischerbacteria bacterium RBG_13_37_8 TaxID=1817863 RepID=A0A1F5VH33_9BACT|nr:MAG: hypothetical protein A2Y62_06265 [Candidatus Fischerbacteria bacterium RBG_13_37_8]
MKAFITGITGFVGSHLSERLLASGFEVAGIDTNESGLQYLPSKKNISFYCGDITDEDFIQRTLLDYQPDWIFHLAGISSVSKSWQNLKTTYQINILGAFNLLESCLLLKNKPRVLLVGSAEEYGKINTKRAIKESFSLKGFSPYAISKITQEYLGIHYYKIHKLPIVRTRSFNHTGPRQSDAFVCSSFCKQVAEIECLGKEAVIKVGNLESCRDFSDVRDVVDAYILLMKKGRASSAYNVCSMKAYSIKDILTMIIGYSSKSITIETDESRFRKMEIPYLMGDNTKLKKLGWLQSYSIEQTLLDSLQYWRTICQGNVL